MQVLGGIWDGGNAEEGGMMKAKINDIVLVEWIDSTEVIGWRSRCELPANEPYKAVTVGHLIRQNKKSIMVSATKGVDSKSVCGTMTIPQASITGIKILKTKGGRK